MISPSRRLITFSRVASARSKAGAQIQRIKGREQGRRDSKHRRASEKEGASWWGLLRNGGVSYALCKVGKTSAFVQDGGKESVARGCLKIREREEPASGLRSQRQGANNKSGT